jgi:hypothetical protein
MRTSAFWEWKGGSLTNQHVDILEEFALYCGVFPDELLK